MKTTVNQRVWAVVILVAALALCLCGCQGTVINQVAPGGAAAQSGAGADSGDQAQPGEQPGQQTPAAAGGLALNIQPAPQVGLDLQPFDGGFFSMDLPKGWVLEPVGEYENFGFRAYDPNNPGRQIFFYGNMKYFMKSDEGRQDRKSVV